MSDEDFVTSMGNRLRMLRLEREGPAWLLWLKRKLRLLGGGVTLTGFEAGRLVALSGVCDSAVGEISKAPGYVVPFHEFEELVSLAQARMTGGKR